MLYSEALIFFFVQVRKTNEMTSSALTCKQSHREVSLCLDNISSLPDSDGKILQYVRFTTCPGNRLYLALRRIMSRCGNHDTSGVFEDSWWMVVSEGLPDRFVRLTKGTKSMYNLLNRYGFIDREDCVHHRNAVLVYGNTEPSFVGEVDVPPHIENATGVPQFYPTSGVCWYASFCWVLFANPSVRKLILSFVPNEAKGDAETCLFDRDAAERFRKFLWYKLSIGDNVERDPYEDGQNGGDEFVVLLSKLRIPLIVYTYTGKGKAMKLDREVLYDKKGKACRPNCGEIDKTEPHLVMLRFVDGDHENTMPIQKRIVICERKYLLCAGFMGQKKCGHQVAFASTGEGGSWKDWGISDADAHKDGIGPMFCHFTGNESCGWWKSWKYIVMLTKFFRNGSRDFCPLSPWNLNNERYEQYRNSEMLRGGKGKSKPGTNSVDVVYRWDGANCPR